MKRFGWFTVVLIACSLWQLAPGQPARPVALTAPASQASASLPGRIALEVPYLRQKGTTDCAVQALGMLLRFHGIEATEEDMCAAISTGAVPGSHFYKVGLFLDSRKIPYTTWYPTGVESLKQLLASNHPVVVPLAVSNERNRTSHAVLVVGYSDQDGAILYHDPGLRGGPLQSLPYSDFDTMWQLGGGFTRFALAVNTKDLEKAQPRWFPFANLAETFEKGQYLAELGKISEAAPCFEASLAKNDRFVPAYVWLGSAYAQLNRKEDAEKAYAKAVELDRACFWGEGLFKLACAEIENGKYKQAQSHLDEYISGEPRFASDLQKAKSIRKGIERIPTSTSAAASKPSSSFK